MIDTDKYEGHTEGPWKAEYGDYTTHVTNSDGVVVASVGFELDKDGQLIADAPLLLQEVKRLQRYEREHKELWDIIANFSPKDSEEDNDTYQEWLDSISQGYMGSVYEYVMMKQEEMIE
tara:strand:+ start:1682 stop:2038 length:357 start_codon:yes stop_codon:yes gene_type:complete